jgi:hypothetical protein
LMLVRPIDRFQRSLLAPHSNVSAIAVDLGGIALAPYARA